MAHTLLLIVTLSLGLPLLPGDATFYVRREDSHFGFSVQKWLVLREEGRFRSFSGTVTYDPARPSATTVDISVDVSSVDSGDDGRDSALRSREFFDASRHPRMTFRSAAVRAGGPDTMLVTGFLTIRGVSKEITIPVRFTPVHHANAHVGNIVGFETRFTINRLDFGIAPERSRSMIGEEVQIFVVVGAGTRRVS